MKATVGTTGLIFNEPLLWEKGVPGRTGFSMPRRDIEEAPMDETIEGEAPDFPDLCEVDVVRHYTRLSQWNFGVDSGMYPLGSCTMKYNPKTNERQAALPGFGAAHPLLPQRLSQGILQLMVELQQYLCEITGMDAVSLQPAAGAHGELTGMMICHAYHVHQGNPGKDPDSRHRPRYQSGQCGLVRFPIDSGQVQ
jgi:glycine dehydrogenase subunit 2